jgi:hypothetical protein
MKPTRYLNFLLALLVVVAVASCSNASESDDSTPTTTQRSSDNDESNEEKEVEETALDDESDTPNYRELEQLTEAGEAPANADPGSMGPWSTSAYVAFSNDGVNFADSEFITAQAGVPDIITDADGRLMAYYIDWGHGNIMAAAIRNDNGTWTRYALEIEGLTNQRPDPVDPSPVLLDDGRIRLYWMHTIDGVASIYSAISDDGISFKLEDGIRFTSDVQIYDPTVVKVEDEWLLVTGPFGEHHAFSEDGLNFADDQGQFVVDGEPAMVWGAWNEGETAYLVTAISGKRPLRLYKTGDAKEFEFVATAIVDGYDPPPDAGITVLDDGSYALAFLTPTS